MKLAVLIQCHHKPEQLIDLIKQLSHPDICFFVHIDKKSDISIFNLSEFANVYILPDSMRVDVRWGDFSQVEATLNLLDYSMKHGKYDHYCLLSGQDFPIVSTNDIINFLEENLSSNFIDVSCDNIGLSNFFKKRMDIIYPNCLLKRDIFHKILKRCWVIITGGFDHTFSVFKRKDIAGYNFYFGSSWWCINNDFAEYIFSYIENNKEYVSMYKLSVCSDESFFQTLLMNSEFADTRKDYLHYIDWSLGGNNPKVLTVEDLDKIYDSKKFFIRKIDYDIDQDIVFRITDHLQNVI